MLTTLHGKAVRRRGNRFYAVRPLGTTRAERVASATQVRGNWDRILSEHRTATVIRNIK